MSDPYYTQASKCIEGLARKYGTVLGAVESAQIHLQYIMGFEDLPDGLYGKLKVISDELAHGINKAEEVGSAKH